MVFFGEYQVSFTGAGRIIIPKKLRELLTGDTFILAKGFDLCLAGYDRSSWEDKARELMSFSLLDAENLEKRRFIFSSTSYVEVDEQGRFVIPKPLLSYAGLKEKAVLIGVGDHFEIWDREKWENYQSQGAK